MPYLSWFRRGVLFWALSFALVSPAFGQKKWTLLLFLNGHNNLDSFGELNINQLESIGSNADIDLIVQYASSRSNTTKRYHIQKDADMKVIHSTIVEDLPRVDMGDKANLVEFVKWGVKNYPADHYFVDIWNHGNGWKRGKGHEIRAISEDDFSGNRISTVQLGEAVKEISVFLGRKLDVLGTDACLMGMVEVAAEIADGAEYFVGSEEVEPAEGWPYHLWMAEVAAKPGMTTPEVLQSLTKNYVAFYTPNGNAEREVSLSAFDLSRLQGIYDSVNHLGTALKSSSTSGGAFFVDAVQSTIGFRDWEYIDLGDLSVQIRKLADRAMSEAPLNELDQAISEVVIAHDGNGKFKGRTKGIAIWAPQTQTAVDSLATRYEALHFASVTNWLETLKNFIN